MMCNTWLLLSFLSFLPHQGLSTLKITLPNTHHAVVFIVSLVSSTTALADLHVFDTILAQKDPISFCFFVHLRMAVYTNARVCHPRLPPLHNYLASSVYPVFEY